MESIKIIAMLTGFVFLLLGGTGMVSPYTVRRAGEGMLRREESLIKSVGTAGVIVSVIMFVLILGSTAATQVVASAAAALLLLLGVFMITPSVIKAVVKEYQYLPDNQYVLFSGVCALLGVLILYAAAR